MRLGKGMVFVLFAWKMFLMDFCFSLIELAELEIKHARSQQELFRKSLQGLQELV